MAQEGAHSLRKAKSHFAWPHAGKLLRLTLYGQFPPTELSSLWDRHSTDDSPLRGFVDAFALLFLGGVARYVVKSVIEAAATPVELHKSRCRVGSVE